MSDDLVGQPLTEMTVFQCPHCSRVLRDPNTHTPYPCPFCRVSRLIVLRTEWDVHPEPHGVPPKGVAEGV
jgi:DNA-directed RNA polymerase subunit RPC12/RpoP